MSEKENNVTKSTFQFNGFKITEANITWNGSLIGNNMNFSVNPTGVIGNDNTLTITLSAVIGDEENNIKIAITMVGNFTFDCKDKKTLISFAGYNAPAIMFPYVRAFVSSITAMSGSAPIILPTINMEPVGKILKEQLKNQITNY